jgi:hypothetical protein
MPLNIKINQHDYLWEKINCPVWLYMLDAIVYDLLRVPVMRAFLDCAKNNENLKIISPECGYIDLLKKKTHGGSLPDNTEYIPFGHFASLNKIDLPKENRLCVIATIGGELGLNPNTNTAQEVVTEYGKDILNKEEKKKLIDILNYQNIPNMPLRLLHKFMNWELDEILNIQNLPLICAIDSYIKRSRRFKAIKSLSGMPIDFYGAGWEKYFPNEKNFRFLGNIKHQEVAQYTKKYKGIINFDPNWEMGVHDRVFTTCAMGIPVITNENSALNILNNSIELIHTYSTNDPQIMGVADYLLTSKMEDHPPNLKNLTDHSWTNRMAQLIL